MNATEIHTPTPWSLDTFQPMSNDHSQWETCTISGAGTPGTIATNVRIENAALIVRAVNAYAAMREALLELFLYAQLDPVSDHQGTRWQPLVTKVKAALAVGGDA